MNRSLTKLCILSGLESVIFLKKKLEWWRWLGMFIILIGLIVVGVSDLVFPVNLIITVYNCFTIYECVCVCV